MADVARDVAQQRHVGVWEHDVVPGGEGFDALRKRAGVEPGAFPAEPLQQ